MTDTYPLSSGIDKLCYLYRAVHLLSARWTALSIQLSVRGLDQIQRNGRTSDICLALSLMEWLQSGEASWKGLVEAVFRPSGGGHQVLARDIANSYKSMMCVQSTLRVHKQCNCGFLFGNCSHNISLFPKRAF